MPAQPTSWRYYIECRPDELAALVKTAPVAFWPLGLIEHHGWHLPVGFDGLKAERICIRIAEKTGGVLLPTMWWGCLGGHDRFLWTHYQPLEASDAILNRMVEQLIAFGFRAILLLAGHYPWVQLLNRRLPEARQAHPDVLFIWGTEVNIAAPDVLLPGDHAGREETSYGLCLLPELMDMRALRPGRDPADSWPAGIAPAEPDVPGVVIDAAQPLFAQFGVDGRLATAVRGEEAIVRLVDQLAEIIQRHLTTGSPSPAQ